MKNSKKIIVCVVLILSIFLLIKGYILVGSLSYSEGERTGTIAKFSHKGLIIKTWEGELHQGGLDQGGVAKVWNFSVKDPKVVEEIHHAQRHGGSYTLKYNQQFLKQSWCGETDYFIVEVIQEGK